MWNPLRWRPVDVLINAHGLASFCLGLVFPYTAIHLADLPAVGTGGVAVFYAASGGTNLVLALLIGGGVLRLPRVTLGVLGTLLWCVGYLGLAMVDTLPPVTVTGACIGAGQGCFMAALIPIVNAMVDEQERRAVFARRYAVLNAALALGALVAGGLTAVAPRSILSVFFVAAGLGILPLTVALVLCGRRARMAATPEPASAPAAERAMPSGTLWALALPAVAFQLAAYLFGFSQFEATAPQVAVDLSGLSLSAVSVMLFLNLAVIVGAQRRMTRMIQLRDRAALRLAVGLWVAGYVVAAATAVGPPGVRLAGLLGYAVLFGLGECVYASSFHPWLVSLVPDRELTRVSAVANATMGVGNLTGPSIGVAMALSGSASVVWLGLAACTGMVVAADAALTGRRRRRIPADVT